MVWSASPRRTSTRTTWPARVFFLIHSWNALMLTTGSPSTKLTRSAGRSPALAAEDRAGPGAGVVHDHVRDVHLAGVREVERPAAAGELGVGHHDAALEAQRFVAQRDLERVREGQRPVPRLRVRPLGRLGEVE